MRRSVFDKIIDENEYSSGEEMAYKMENAGMQFDPEEESAVDKFNSKDALYVPAKILRISLND
jgi:hypothetical protein